eukprot:7098589-Prymnesium_polylepis.1
MIAANLCGRWASRFFAERVFPRSRRAPSLLHAAMSLLNQSAANQSFAALVARRDGKSTGGPEVANGKQRSLGQQQTSENLMPGAPPPARRKSKEALMAMPPAPVPALQ